MNEKKNILVLCAHLHGDRTAKRDRDFMQPSTGLHIASLIDQREYNVSLYQEMWHGTADVSRLPTVSVVFLTGLQKDFDRMRQFAYFFKAKGAITVAGGSICTFFPEFATEFFDVVCAGGVDSVAEVMTDYKNGHPKRIYRSPQTTLGDYRIDYKKLAESGINNAVHLVEASRGCNFRCDFCVIPAEGARHTRYGVERTMEMVDDSIAHSPLLSLRRAYPLIWFIDNNFSNHQPYLKELCGRLGSHRRVKGWGALVTQDTLANRELILGMARAKCRCLFVGLESLDVEFLERHNKPQNSKSIGTIIDDIRYAQDQGISIAYGYLFDPRFSTTGQMAEQLRRIVDSGVLSFPSFLSYVAPLLGTPVFWKAADKGELRPNLRLRDLDCRCICYKNCLDDDAELTAFSQKIFLEPASLIDRKKMLLSLLRLMGRTAKKHPFLHYLNYRNHFRAFHLVKKRSTVPSRTYIAGTDILDPQYASYPAHISKAEKERYFDPVLVTDEHGALAEWLRPYRDQALWAMPVAPLGLP